MGINQVSYVTDTVTDTVTDVLNTKNNLEGLLLRLKKLKNSVDNLKNANVFSKASAAEGVLGDAYDFMSLSGYILHELSGEVADLRAELVNMKRHGFGG